MSRNPEAAEEKRVCKMHIKGICDVRIAKSPTTKGKMGSGS